MRLLTKLKIPLAIIGVGLAISIISRLLKISNIECSSQLGECGETLAKKLGDIEGTPYLTAKMKVKNVLEDDATTQKYSVHFQLPSKLEVDIIESKTKYALSDPDSKRVSLVADDGTVLATADSTNLPLLIVKNYLPDVGIRVDGKILFACEIVYLLKRGYEYEAARIENDKLIVELEVGPTVIFPLEGDRDFLLGAFNLVMAELRNAQIDSKIKNPSTVDLRFKNPVLKY